MKNEDLKSTLPAPPKPEALPASAQWLAGEGAGSWFVIAKTRKKNYYKISRFSPKGKLECKGIFSQEHNMENFDIELPYTITHLSHCAQVSVIQNSINFSFSRFADV